MYKCSHVTFHTPVQAGYRRRLLGKHVEMLELKWQRGEAF